MDEWHNFIDCRRQSHSLLNHDSPTQSRYDRWLKHQAALSRRAAKKFSDPERWLWTSKLFEQASDEKVASLTARSFPTDQHVFDVCCGAGSDTVAIARRGPVTAFDLCSLASRLTRANLETHSFPIKKGQIWIERLPAESIQFPEDVWLHIDPDRRADGKRTSEVNRFQPNVEFLADAIMRTAGGSVKVAPATSRDSLISLHSRWKPDLSTKITGFRSEKIGRQFTGWGRSVRQQRWWWNLPEYPAGTVTVTVLSASGDWHHRTYDDCPVENPHNDPMARTTRSWLEIGDYVGDLDGCIHAANIQKNFLCDVPVYFIHSSNGFIHATHCEEELSPFVDWFKIEDILPFDRKRLRAYLRQRGVGTVEIKARTAEVIPEKLRPELKLSGAHSRTLLITRCGGRTIAIIAHRLDE